MKFGAEPKKLAVLGVLSAVAVVVFMINSTGSGPAAPATPQSARSTPSGPAVANTPGAAARETSPRTPSRGRGGSEFRPRVGTRRGEAQVDPATIDPTLRLDLLAKLQDVKVEGPHRSIFDFSQPPPPKPDPKQVAEAKKPAPSPIVKPDAAKPDTPAEPAKPQAPPIPLKFYGYLSRTAQPAKRAFFMDGDDIHVVSEGETVKKRYKIVRIGVNSVVVEDTQFGQQQTLPLEEQPG
jgi:hypothetical protein